MFFSRLITSLVLGAAMVAAAAASKSGTSIQHDFKAGSAGKGGNYVSEDIKGVVDNVGKVSGNATLLWTDDYVESSSILQVPGSDLQAYTVSYVDNEAHTSANTTTKGGWAASEIRLMEGGKGTVLLQSLRPMECRHQTGGPKAAWICTF